MHFVAGIGLISQVTAQGSSYYYDFDSIGNTVGITNASGQYVNQYSYLPFGQVAASTGTLSNPFTYVGMLGVMSNGDGSYLMDFRSYDPETGQFLSNDPLGLDGGDTNIRRYVENNPVTLADPIGLGYFVGGDAFGIGGESPADWANGNDLDIGHTSYVTDDGRVIEYGCGPTSPEPGEPLWIIPPGATAGTKLIPNPAVPAAQYLPRPTILDKKHYDDAKILKKWKDQLQHTTYFPLPLGPFQVPWGSLLNLQNCHSFCHIVAADDPNNIVGPAGYGDQNFVLIDQVLAVHGSV